MKSLKVGLNYYLNKINNTILFHLSAMKKLVLIIIFGVLLISIKTFGQSNYTTVKVDGISIKIPMPSKNYYKILTDKNNIFKSYIPDGNKLLVAYVDSIDNNIIANGTPDKASLKKCMFVQSNKPYENISISEKQLKEIRIENFGRAKYVLQQLLDSNTYYIEKYRKNNSGIFTETSKNIGVIYENKNAFGLLVSIVENDGTKYQFSTCIAGYVKVKNRLIFTFVFTDYNYNSDIIWASNVSERWAKAIIDANKQ